MKKLVLIYLTVIVSCEPLHAQQKPARQVKNKKQWVAYQYPIIPSHLADPFIKCENGNNMINLRKNIAALGNEGGIQFSNKKDRTYPSVYLRKSATNQ